MEIAYIFIAFVQSLGVSIGVGCSTVAILNFLVAVRDGVVDESERRIMKVVYTVLRIAMGLILITMFLQGLMLVSAYGTYYFNPFVVSAWFTVIMLYLNAILMTKKLMPRSIGPSLQVASWYTLAVLYFLSTVNLIYFTYLQFFAGFALVLLIAMMVINGTMAYLKLRVKN